MNGIERVAGRRVPTAAAVAIVGVLVLGGCRAGGPDEAATAATATTAPAPTTAVETSSTTTAPAPARVVGIEVSEKQNAFIPAVVEIQAGEGVAFINQDPVLHQIMTERDVAVEFDLTTEAGQTATTPALVPGRYDYVCVLHDNMAGQITVV